jgi:hypothetical protein
MKYLGSRGVIEFEVKRLRELFERYIESKEQRLKLARARSAKQILNLRSKYLSRKKQLAGGVEVLEKAAVLSGYAEGKRLAVNLVSLLLEDSLQNLFKSADVSISGVLERFETALNYLSPSNIEFLEVSEELVRDLEPKINNIDSTVKVQGSKDLKNGDLSITLKSGGKILFDASRDLKKIIDSIDQKLQDLLKDT